jgi:hypothetical protein
VRGVCCSAARGLRRRPRQHRRPALACGPCEPDAAQPSLAWIAHGLQSCCGPASVQNA